MIRFSPIDNSGARISSMEGNGLQNRMYSNMAGLDVTLQNRQPAAAGKTIAFCIDQQQNQLSVKQSFPYVLQPHKPHHSNAASDDEDHGGSANDEGGCSGAKRRISPWQRMKWTDAMVKLLLMAVYYIGDEVGVVATTTSSDGAESKRHKQSGAAANGGQLQKKGKWKSVSQAMMEKGYCVSPQQCEDKFNDLNKRYKRVNDILGRGTACRVVENQSILESMNLLPKLKEEVRKLLNSKHLFFREMCAYHNSCGQGGSPAVHHSLPEPAPEQRNSNFKRHDDDETEDDTEEEGDCGYGDENQEEESWERKRPRLAAPASEQMKSEIAGILGDGSKSAREKQQWLMMRQIQVEEAGLKYQMEGLEIEKQRLKWIKYSTKKEMELERMKVENERRRLGNERMLLFLKQKELEFSTSNREKNRDGSGMR